MVAIESSKTHRFYLLLKEQITSGVLAHGARLPGEPELATRHNLSRVTVRRALDGLAREGLVTKRPGAGTYVSRGEGTSPVTGDLTDMLAHLKAMGRDTSVRLLAFGYGVAPDVVARALKLPEGAQTQQAVRVRSLRGEPFSHLVTHVPADIGRRFDDRDLADTPMLTLLERLGIVVAHADQSITATLAGPEAAAALGVEIGAPLIALTRTVFDANGQGVEFLSAQYRPDRHRFHMQLTRAGEGAERYWRTARPSADGVVVSKRREAAPRRRKP
jgi:GntR family transcriptional regulator